MRHRRKASKPASKPLAKKHNETTINTETIACFAYGSNGTEQLRERCKNPNLVSLKAAIRDYQRFFTGNSRKWEGGGVASLAPQKGHLCKGSVEIGRAHV